ncbi:hypothetical protein [Vampirovibrio sp.]
MKTLLSILVVLATVLGGAAAFAASGCCPGPCCGATAECCQ